MSFSIALQSGHDAVMSFSIALQSGHDAVMSLSIAIQSGQTASESLSIAIKREPRGGISAKHPNVQANAAIETLTIGHSLAIMNRTRLSTFGHGDPPALRAPLIPRERRSNRPEGGLRDWARRPAPNVRSDP
jgi:hypothetical protein